MAYGRKLCIVSLAIAAFLVTAGACSQCSVQRFTQQARACVNTFVDSYRRDPTADCSLKYNQVANCTMAKMQECLSGQADNRTSRAVRHMAYVYTANKDFYCRDGMLITLENLQPPQLPMCSSKFFKRVANCRARFLRKYRRNRGSPTLCWRYSRAKECMQRTLRKHCKETRLTQAMIAAYKDTYNPYCSYKRRDPGSEKAKHSPFGRCSQQGYVIKSRDCITAFVRALQRNNGKNCRATVNDILLKCIKRTVKRCLRGTRDDDKLEDDVNKSLSQQRTEVQNKFCEGGPLETLQLNAGQCTNEYFETFQGKCNSRFIAKYRANTADPELCREYAEVKRCARNMTLSLCSLDEDTKQSVDFVYGNYNPFCPDAKDPVRLQGQKGKPWKQTTLDAANNSAAEGKTTSSLVILLVVILIAIIL